MVLTLREHMILFFHSKIIVGLNEGSCATHSARDTPCGVNKGQNPPPIGGEKNLTRGNLLRVNLDRLGRSATLTHTTVC